MKYIYSLICCLIIVLICQRCASIQQPTGGEKDIQAPTLLNSTPKQKELNVRTKQITLEFDEAIKEKELLRQLLITPQLLDNNYEALAKGNKLILKFKRNLEENTTFTFQFRNGIVDATEGNIAPNVKLVFSTGTFIDSAKITAKITNINTGKGSSKQVLALYPNADTAYDIKNSNPFYYTQTDEGGNGTIENIRKGTYLIRAFDDKNENLKYDDNESIDWVKEEVTIDSNHNYRFFLFPQYSNKFQIATDAQYKEVSTIELNKGFTYYKFLKTDSIKYISLEKNKFTIYHSEPYPKDTIKLAIALSDSANNLDTIQYNYVLNPKKPYPFDIISYKPVNLITNKLIPSAKIFTLDFKDSLVRIDTNKIRAKIDTLNTIISFKKEANKLHINLPKSPKKSLQILIDSGAVTNAIGKTILKNDTLNYGVLTEEDLGILEFKLTNFPDSIPYYIEVSKNKELIITIPKQKNNTYKLRNLEPGNYSLKAVVDVNNNKRQDYGNLDKLIKGEIIIHYPSEIPIKANWEINDVEWIYPQENKLD